MGVAPCDSATVHDDLVDVLRLDLIGPRPCDEARQRERLSQAPSRNEHLASPINGDNICPRHPRSQVKRNWPSKRFPKHQAEGIRAPSVATQHRIPVQARQPDSDDRGSRCNPSPGQRRTATPEARLSRPPGAVSRRDSSDSAEPPPAVAPVMETDLCRALSAAGAKLDP